MWPPSCSEPSASLVIAAHFPLSLTHPCAPMANSCPLFSPQISNSLPTFTDVRAFKLTKKIEPKKKKKHRRNFPHAPTTTPTYPLASLPICSVIPLATHHSYKFLASIFQSDHYLIFKTKRNKNPKESKTTEQNQIYTSYTQARPRGFPLFTLQAVF